VENLIELIDIVTTLEEGPSAEQFRKDTANRPDVNYKML